jgi:hypothetical protein
VTKVAETLLDIAESLPAADLQSAFDEAQRRRLTSLPALDRVMARNRGRHGLRPLRALVDERRRSPTRSELERRFLRLCAAAGLPAPEVNTYRGGYEVDACWEEQRLVIELDSWEHHRTRAAFERDRSRDAALHLAGFRVLRLTYRKLEDAPAEVAATVRSLLGP